MVHLFVSGHPSSTDCAHCCLTSMIEGKGAFNLSYRSTCPTAVLVVPQYLSYRSTCRTAVLVVPQMSCSKRAALAVDEQLILRTLVLHILQYTTHCCTTFTVVLHILWYYTYRMYCKYCSYTANTAHILQVLLNTASTARIMQISFSSTVVLQIVRY
jgi:hypothetical protein